MEEEMMEEEMMGIVKTVSGRGLYRKEKRSINKEPRKDLHPDSTKKKKRISRLIKQRENYKNAMEENEKKQIIESAGEGDGAQYVEEIEKINAEPYVEVEETVEEWMERVADFYNKQEDQTDDIEDEIEDNDAGYEEWAKNAERSK